MNKTAVALGTFDGLHLGHAAVLAAAEGCDKKIALTFNRPPAQIIKGECELLTTEGKKRELLGELGFCVEPLDFSQVRDMSGDEFLEYIKGRLGPKRICCGFNYHFGKNGEGGAEKLCEFCTAEGIELCVLPPVVCDGIRVSSSEIRKRVKAGEIEEANRMLGRSFSIGGVCSHGDSRGRKMGIPTVNFPYPDGMAEARHGVYVSHCFIAGKKYRAVTYIGNRPSYALDFCTVETNLLGFSGDLYDSTVEVFLDKFLRDDRKFASLSELKAQIEADIYEVLK